MCSAVSLDVRENTDKRFLPAFNRRILVLSEVLVIVRDSGGNRNRSSRFVLPCGSRSAMGKYKRKKSNSVSGSASYADAAAGNSASDLYRLAGHAYAEFTVCTDTAHAVFAVCFLSDVPICGNGTDGNRGGCQTGNLFAL